MDTTGRFHGAVGAPHRPESTPDRGSIGRTAAEESATLTFPQAIAFFYWILTLFEFEMFVSARLGGPFFRLPTLLAPIITLMTLANLRRASLYWPLILFFTLHVGASVLAANAGLVRLPARHMFYVLLLMTTTGTFLYRPGHLRALLQLLLISELWFGVQGIPSGRVDWHQLLGNEDAFGPLMVITIPFAYFFALATNSRKWRRIAQVTLVVSIVGLVASFARGAVLSAGVVLLFMVLRSPNRGRAMTILFGALAVALTLIAAVLPAEAWIQEMQTSGEGDPTRMTLWHLAWEVFKTSPVFGVGASNFGVIADRIATPAERALIWGAMYYRTTHMAALQVLAEEGLVGIVLWGTMIANFFRWNGQFRASNRATVGSSTLGSEFDARLISYGLDGAMLGYLLTSIFYNQIYYIHWFWSLLTIARYLSLAARGHTAGIALTPTPHNRAARLIARARRN